MYIVGDVLPRPPGPADHADSPGSACTVELSGVLVVGTLSIVEPSGSPTTPCGPDFGSGYGYVPAVLPFLGLAWLFHTTRGRRVSGTPTPP